MKKVLIFIGIILFIILANNLINWYNSSIDAEYGITEKPKKEVKLNSKLKFDGLEFTITNLDNFDYENVVLILNDDYEYNADLIASGKTYSVGILQFSNDDDDRFTFNKKPKELKMTCKVYGEFAISAWKLEK